ncbi:hypothetical protein GCM10020295_72680 [Streptomyces cinereospinus]
MEGDFTKPDTLYAALDGVRRAFVFPLFGAIDGFLAHARRSGVERLVLLSSSAVTFRVPGWIGAAHQRNEAEVRASGIDATFVRPTLFMANDLAWAGQIAATGVVRGPYAKAPHGTRGRTRRRRGGVRGPDVRPDPRRRLLHRPPSR